MFCPLFFNGLLMYALLPGRQVSVVNYYVPIYALWVRSDLLVNTLLFVTPKSWTHLAEG
jgi:hypothetical protein